MCPEGPTSCLGGAPPCFHAEFKVLGNFEQAVGNLDLQRPYLSVHDSDKASGRILILFNIKVINLEIDNAIRRAHVGGTINCDTSVVTNFG
jgi:hypothetical protein